MTVRLCLIPKMMSSYHRHQYLFIHQVSSKCVGTLNYPTISSLDATCWERIIIFTFFLVNWKNRFYIGIYSPLKLFRIFHFFNLYQRKIWQVLSESIWKPPLIQNLFSTELARVLKEILYIDLKIAAVLLGRTN